MAVMVKMGRAIKAKDTPWDAVLMGSVACTVSTNIYQFLYIYTQNSLKEMLNTASIFLHPFNCMKNIRKR